MAIYGNSTPRAAPCWALSAQSLLPIDPALLIKLLNTALVIALTLLIYQLAQKLSGKPSAGIFAALFWAWWEPVYGNIMLYFETLLALCILLACDRLLACRRASDAQAYRIDGRPDGRGDAL